MLLKLVGNKFSRTRIDLVLMLKHIIKTTQITTLLSSKQFKQLRLVDQNNKAVLKQK